MGEKTNEINDVTTSERIKENKDYKDTIEEGREKIFNLKYFPITKNIKTLLYLLSPIFILLLFIGLISLIFSPLAFLIVIIGILAIMGIIVLIGAIQFGLFNFLYKEDGLKVYYKKDKQYYHILKIKNYLKWIIILPGILGILGVLLFPFNIFGMVVGGILLIIAIIIFITSIISIEVFNFVSSKYVAIKIMIDKENHDYRIKSIDIGSFMFNSAFTGAIKEVINYLIVLIPLSLIILAFLPIDPSLLGLLNINPILTPIIILIDIITKAIGGAIGGLISGLIGGIWYNFITSKFNIGYYFRGDKGEY